MQMTGCPVRVYCRLVEGKWEIGHKQTGYRPLPHNHPTSDISLFTSIRRERIAPYKDSIIDDWNSGLALA